jgi:HK97 family phage portal protein
MSKKRNNNKRKSTPDGRMRKKGFNFSDFSSGLNQSVSISINTFYNLYKRNGDIRTCIRKIAKKIGVRGLYLTTPTGQVINNTKAVKKITSLFSTPTFLDWKVEVEKSRKIGGELYITPNMDGFDNLVSFQVLDPRTMTKYIDSMGNITGFRQFSGKGEVKTYGPDEIAYYQYETDSDNNAFGLSALEGVVWDALTDLNANKSNYYFFDNDSVPRAVFLLNDGMDYEDEEVLGQVQNLQEQLKGADQKHKSIASNLVKDVKPIAVNNKDMEFINQRKLTTEKVCATLEVPKFILGYVDNVNHANGQGLYTQWIETVIKAEEEYYEFVMNDLIKRFAVDAPGIVIQLEGEDTSDSFKIHEDQRKDIEAGVLTVDEVREERGLEAKEAEEEEEEEIVETD